MAAGVVVAGTGRGGGGGGSNGVSCGVSGAATTRSDGWKGVSVIRMLRRRTRGAMNVGDVKLSARSIGGGSSVAAAASGCVPAASEGSGGGLRDRGRV